MMTKIVITNHGHKLNKGNQALLNSRVSALKRLIPDAEFSIFTFHPEIKNELQDVKILGAIGRISLSRRTLLAKETWQTMFLLLRCSLWSILHRYFRWDSKLLRNDKGLTEYYNADIIVSTGGDVLTEDYGTLPFLSYVVNFLFALLLSRPVVLYAASIGPFKCWWNRAIGKFLFNRVKLITLREDISRKYLEGLKIKAPMYLTADSAFLLEPVTIQKSKEILGKEGIRENNRPFVGISVSKIISRYGFDEIACPSEKYLKYTEIIAEIVDYLVDTLKATVIFIPHVVGPCGNDDRTVAEDVLKLTRNKENIISIKNEYTAEEIKGIIGQCNLFIGARMHATIASVSMCVPTVAIAYSRKTHGIIGDMLGYKHYVLDIRNLDYNSLLSAVNDGWSNREEIRKELELKVKKVQQSALLNAELVKKLIEHRRKKQKDFINKSLDIMVERGR